MEPMTMGSPTNFSSSPPGGGGGGTYHASTQGAYLPAYLMGEPHSLSSPGSRWMTGGSSPPRANQRRSFAAGHTPYSFNNNSRLDTSARECLPGGGAGSSGGVGVRNKERGGAPPVLGLMESFTGNTSLPFRADEPNCSSLAQSYLHPDSGSVPCGGGLNQSTVGSHNTSLFNTSQRDHPSPTQIDPFYTQGESLCVDEVLDDTWVTVFGFPPATTSFILQEFSQYGNILKHIVAPNGNWLRIQYQSRLQARKALSKNGKVFGGSVMVGVSPCIDKSVMAYAQSSPCPEGAGEKPSGGGSLNASQLRTPGSSRPTSMRPLTASYHGTGNDAQPRAPRLNRKGRLKKGKRFFAGSLAQNQTVVGRSVVPQKNSGVISKAFEYMFGW